MKRPRNWVTASLFAVTAAAMLGLVASGLVARPEEIAVAGFTAGALLVCAGLEVLR